MNTVKLAYPKAVCMFNESFDSYYIYDGVQSCFDMAKTVKEAWNIAEAYINREIKETSAKEWKTNNDL